MNCIELLQRHFMTFLRTTYDYTPAPHTTGTFELNTDENKQHFGDINSNAALILAKKLGKNPREIAQAIADTFHHEHIEKIEVAGPGFLNIVVTPQVWQILAFELFTKKDLFFKLDEKTPKKTYSIEYVSANPTGPLHFGHGRGAIIGDVLGNIINFLGHTALKEYYINDAGAQINKLGHSFNIRCQQAAGHEANLPEDAYHGEYLLELARKCIHENGTAVLDQPEEFFKEYAKNHLLEKIKQTLTDYGVTFDVWFSERKLHNSGAITQALQKLADNGYLYTDEGALWFKSTDFGDDKDRVVRKKSGELTYAAADIAYMLDKVKRGADYLIMVLGHDHHSYVTRLHGIHDALKIKAPLEVILYQLVKLKSGKENVRMSKRAGTIVTLHDVIDLVGTDVARFFYLNRKADAQLELDLSLALKKTEENPVYYAQYAYVRTGSILAKAAEHDTLSDISSDDLAGIGSAEALVLKKLVELKELLTTVSTNHQTHLLTYYVLELAQLFHSYYAKNRIIDRDAIAQSRARLAVVHLVRNTLCTALKLLGISTPETM